MDIREIFRAEGNHLTWKRLPDDHVAGATTGQPIEADGAYFIVRLTEMFLGRTRTLWRKFYPMVHGFGTFAGIDEHAVVGPGQLQDLGEANLERVINVNTRLFGPTPYKGGDVSLLVGLYSVPGQDAAKALVTTVGTIAGLAGPATLPAVELMTALKSGIDSILSLPATKLRLGVRDTFFPNNPLRAGFHVGIGAAETDVRFESLWLRDGRLVVGSDPVVARPYEANDYLVLQIEARDHRVDWPSLPGVASIEQEFQGVLADTALAPAEKRKRLGVMWPRFTEALRTSLYVTRADADFIADNLASDLKARLEAMEQGNPFETRSSAGEALVRRDPADLDFADIPNYALFNDPRSPAALDAKLF